MLAAEALVAAEAVVEEAQAVACAHSPSIHERCLFPGAAHRRQGYRFENDFALDCYELNYLQRKGG